MNPGQQTILNDMLAQLVEIGYGRTRGEVRDYLVQRSLDDLLRAQVIVPRIDVKKRMLDIAKTK